MPNSDGGQMPQTPNDDNQSMTAHRYNRIAKVYDALDAPMEWMGGDKRRQRLLSQAEGQTLEVGIGTGRNLDFYPDEVDLTGVDISSKMLAQAKKQAEKLGVDPRLEEADVEDLPFPDDSFDTVTSTSVFCSVDDPIRGLREIQRVVKPEGQVLMLEHVRPRGKITGPLSDKLTGVTRRVFGFNINRQTEQNIDEAGLEIVDIRREGVWREIVARPQ